MREMFKYIFILLSLTFCLNAQTINIEKLDSLISSLSSHNLAMGNLTIFHNGSIAYQKALGSSFIDGDKKIYSNINTRYRIGSVTKMFTAALILKLIEEEGLNFNTTLDKYYPNLPNAGLITIRDLLYHRSGLHNYTEDSDYDDWMDISKSRNEMLEIISGLKVNYQPNEKAEYCNSNFLLLSYIIEDIYQKPYGKIIDEKITSLIGLEDTYYGSAIDLNKGESCSYKYADFQWEKNKEADITNHHGAGAIVSTTTGLTKFIRALFSGKLISKKSLDKMKTIVEGYGMGIFKYFYDSEISYGHDGRTEGFYSSLRYFPSDDIAIAYCTNGMVYPIDDILQGVVKICFEQPYSIPNFEPINLSSNELDKYPGIYSSDEMQITVECKRNDTSLIIETKGELFPLEALGNHTFMNKQFGYFFEFNPAKNTLSIKETDYIYSLSRSE